MFGSAASGMPCVAHRLEARASAAVGPAPWFVPIAATSSSASRSRRGSRADPAGDLGLVVEGQQRDDRERRDAAHRLDRDDELVEVEERLDHEEVDAAALEHAGLLGVERAVLGGVEHLELAERADRAGDEDVAARDLARLAREPHARRVDLLERRRRGTARASLRRLAPKVFVSISSAPAAM